MRIFNILIMSKRKFHDEKREAKKNGHRVALGTFKKSDKIVYGGHYIIKGKEIREKLVLLGDGQLIIGNIFSGSTKGVEVQ